MSALIFFLFDTRFLHILNRFVIVSFVENRAREIGVAVVDLANVSEVRLMQISDSQSYRHILRLISELGAVEILVNAGHKDRYLIKKLMKRFGTGGERDGSTNHETDVIPVSTKYFNDTLGAWLLLVACSAFLCAFPSFCVDTHPFLH